MTEDASIRACPQCGTPLPGDAPQGLCPQCLLMNGLASRTAGMDSAVNTTPTMGQSDAGSRGAYRSAGRFIPPTVEQLAPLLPQMEILELLGQGGMGAVYKARQRGLDRLVAVKILPPDLGQLPGFADRFTREARALAKLNHPNIVSVFDFGQTAGFGETASESDIHTDANATLPRPLPKREGSQTGGLYYLIMEYIDGVNLRQAMRSGALTPPDALAIVPQVCEALQFAHDEGIVHRDIKPENILIDKRGKVKIADFGLAKLVAHDPDDVTLTREGGTMGTPHYMAPEQVEGAHGVDHRADIYSLGVVFYEMLTGELPLGRFAVPSKKVKIDVRLDEVVLRSLEREPELRYQHASEMKTQVDRVRGLTPAMIDRVVGREYKSKATLFGLPLLHIAFGLDPKTGRKRVAKGIIAIGDVAKGVVALGGLAMGGIAFGGVAVGVISIGGLSLGLLLAVGGVALGALAFGGLAMGGVALGGMAVGFYAYGGEAMGAHIWSSKVVRIEARRFFEGWAGDWSKWLTLMGIFLPIAAVLISVFSWLVLRAEGQIDADHPSDPPSDVAAQVHAPATWLAGTAVLNWMLGIILILLIFMFGPPHLMPGRKPVPLGPLAIVMILSMVASGVMLIGAMRMRRLEGSGLAKLGAVCAMLVTPGNIIGLPVGIWVLEVLGRRKVRDAFDESVSASHDPHDPRSPQPPARTHTLLPALSLCLVTVPYLMGAFMSIVTGIDITDGQDMKPVYVGYLRIALGIGIVVMVALILRGAWHLLSLTRRGPAVLAGLLAFPVGLWALVVLSRPAVRDAFEEQDAAASPEPARPRAVPVLAIINILFGVAMLFMVVFAALPADGSDQVNALWDQATPALATVRTMEMVLLPVQYLAAGLMLASGIGLLMWRPWGRKLAVGVCIYMLIDFFVQVPILVMSVLIPMWKLVRDPRYAHAMGITDLDELFSFTIVLTFICLGVALAILTYLIAQLVLLTRDRVVTAFEKDQPERVVTV